MVLEQVSGSCLLESFQRVGDPGEAAGERKRAAGAEHCGGDDQVFGAWRAGGQPGEHRYAERPGSRQGARAVVQEADGYFLKQRTSVQRVAAGMLVQSFSGPL